MGFVPTKPKDGKTDRYGRVLGWEEVTPDATYIDRDGKEYPAYVEREYENTAVTGDSPRTRKTRTIQVADLQVEFISSKGHSDWRPVPGVMLQVEGREYLTKARYLKTPPPADETPDEPTAVADTDKEPVSTGKKGKGK